MQYEVSAKAGEVQRLFGLPAGSIPNTKPFFDVHMSVSKQVSVKHKAHVEELSNGLCRFYCSTVITKPASSRIINVG